MTLIDTLKRNALESMKAKDGLATTIYRLAQSEVQAAELRAGRALTDDEGFAVVRKLLKSNEETLAASSGDSENAATLTRENELLRALLPKGLSLEELKGHLAGASAAIRGAGNDGQATGLAMKHLKGLGISASGAEVTLVVKTIRSE